jgi:hypothetical protein
MKMNPLEWSEMYQTGDIRYLEDGDPVHSNREDAEQAAITLSRTDPDGFFGVWTGPDDGSELLAIVHAGRVYRGAA